MIGRLLRWWRLRRGRVYVRLVFEDGPPKLLGPMERYGAELFLALRVSPDGAWDGRRVLSARIIGR